MLFFEASSAPLARSRAGLLRAGLVLALVASGCGSDDDDPAGTGGEAGSTAGAAPGGSGGDPSSSGSGGDAPVGGASGAGGGDSADCNVETVESPPTSFDHLLQCSEVTYDTNPPSGGSHYAIWPAFQSYDFPLPAGFVVHALEHGAVVFWYNCPEGCADEVAEVEAFIASLPDDPLCEGASTPRRTVLVPYPELATRWGASSWGFSLTADCFDAEAFGQFYTDHVGNGREALCAAGQPFTANPCE
jgi:hypothetical protein